MRKIFNRHYLVILMSIIFVFLISSCESKTIKKDPLDIPYQNNCYCDKVNVSIINGCTIKENGFSEKISETMNKEIFWNVYSCDSEEQLIHTTNDGEYYQCICTK